MEDKALRSLPWAFLTNIGKKFLTLSTTVVLARLLVPGDFGLVAAAMIVIGSLNALSDLGVGGVLVVRRQLSEREKSTILGVMVGMSAATSVLIGAAAPIIADLFSEARIVTVLRVLLIGELVGGFTWFYQNLLTRELEFRKRFHCELAQALALGFTSILGAVLGLGYWSVVAGIFVGRVIYTIALIVKAPYRVRPHLEPAIVRDLVRQGTGFNVQGAVTVLQTSVDYVAVGHVLGPGRLGYYSMSYRVAEQGYWAIADVVGRVFVPAFARMRERGEDVTAAFGRTLQLVALLSCPLGLVLSGVARPFTETVFGNRWLPMVGPLSVLGLWAAARPIQYTMSWYLASQNRAGLEAGGSLALFLVQAPLLFLAARHGDIVAVAWVMLGHSVASGVVYAGILRRWMGVGLGRQWAAVRSALVAGALCWGTTRIVAGIEILGPVGATLAATAAGLATYALAVAVLDPAAMRDLRAQAGRLRASPDPLAPTA